MIKTYLSKTSIFKAFAAICIFGISISGCTSKKKTPMETTDTTENELTMLVGTYTSGTSKGIYSYRFNEEDGDCHSVKVTRKLKILLILFHLPTGNSSMQSVNSIIHKLPPMHLPSIKKKELCNY